QWYCSGAFPGSAPENMMSIRVGKPTRSGVTTSVSVGAVPLHRSGPPTAMSGAEGLEPQAVSNRANTRGRTPRLYRVLDWPRAFPHRRRHPPGRDVAGRGLSRPG